MSAWKNRIKTSGSRGFVGFDWGLCDIKNESDALFDIGKNGVPTGHKGLPGLRLGTV